VQAAIEQARQEIILEKENISVSSDPDEIGSLPFLAS
jgi:hypothetical protein